MTRFIVCAVLLSVTVDTPLRAQAVQRGDSTRLAVVRQLTAAHNAHDADAVAAMFADSIRLHLMLRDSVVTLSRAAMRQRYDASFSAMPAQRLDVVDEMVVGRMVVRHERITADSTTGTRFTQLQLYLVDRGRIAALWTWPELAEVDTRDLPRR